MFMVKRGTGTGFSSSFFSFPLLIIILTYQHAEVYDSADLAEHYYICGLHVWDLPLTWHLAAYRLRSEASCMEP